MTYQKPKPCPFCGGTDVVPTTYENIVPDAMSVFCRGCGCSGPVSLIESGVSKAVDDWNRRACKSCGNIAAGWYEYDPGKAG